MRSINAGVFQPLAIRPPKGAGVFATEFSRLVFLESRIASPVASIGGELEREAGGSTPLRHLSLNVGLAYRTRELSRTTRVQSIAARQTGIVTTTKNEN